jgi:hypothetical protein
MYCSMWLQLRINLTLGLLSTKHITNGDQWNGGHTVTETHVFDRIYMSALDHHGEGNGTLAMMCRSTAFS